jgi:hypothetical protein
MPFVRVNVCARRCPKQESFGERLRRINGVGVPVRLSPPPDCECDREFREWVREQRRREAIEYGRIRHMVIC